MGRSAERRMRRHNKPSQSTCALHLQQAAHRFFLRTHTCNSAYTCISISASQMAVPRGLQNTVFAVRDQLQDCIHGLIVIHDFNVVQTLCTGLLSAGTFPRQKCCADASICLKPLQHCFVMPYGVFLPVGHHDHTQPPLENP